MANKSVVLFTDKCTTRLFGKFPISLSDQQRGIIIAWVKRAWTNTDQSGEGRS